MKSNLNTILLAIMIGVISWVGVQSWEQGKTTAVLASTQIIMSATVSRLEGKIDVSVPRAEYERHVQENNARLMMIETRLREIDIELVKLRPRARDQMGAVKGAIMPKDID